MSNLKPKVAVVGAGYWGKNLVRNFHKLDALACVCDERAEVLANMKAEYGVNTTSHLDDVLADRESMPSLSLFQPPSITRLPSAACWRIRTFLSRNRLPCMPRRVKN